MRVLDDAETVALVARPGLAVLDMGGGFVTVGWAA